MKKRSFKQFTVLCGLLGGLAIGTTSHASNHEPEFRHRRSDRLEARVELSGLSRDSVRVELVAFGTAEVRCVDRQGRTRGRDQVDFRVRGNRNFSSRDIDRGRLNVQVSTREVDELPRVRCPRNTRQRIDEVSFYAADLEARQGRRRVAEFRCTFNPTRRGERARNVRCR